MRVYAGLVWPDKGYPSYYCILTEKKGAKEEGFGDKEPTIEITKEGLVDNLAVFLEFPKHKCVNIYTDTDPRQISFVRDFNRYKREHGLDLILKKTSASSIEAGVLKIKEFIKDKRLLLPETSLIKDQLTVFSKENLLEPTSSYAVRSLCMVMDRFKKPVISTTKEEPPSSYWW